MYPRKLSLWLITSIVFIMIGGLALPGATARSLTARSALPQSPPEAATLPVNLDDFVDFQTTAPAYQGRPTSITMDAQGYTIWTYDNWREQEYWCVQFSRLRWPFDLGAQDPTELSETTLIFTFAQKVYTYDTEGNPNYTDPTWAVALNGKPGPWIEGAFTGEWNIIGGIGTTPTRVQSVFVTQEVPFDHTLLIDGENNLWFQQQDFGYCSGLPDCACTCYDLARIQLRARAKLGVREVSPPAETVHVNIDQHRNPEIRVRFTTLVSETTVNADTFQVYYLNEGKHPVYVPGEPFQLSDVEFIFLPDAPLLDGVRYHARLWGQNDALAENHADWVQDLSGGPLEVGRHWTFWTLPQLEVRLKPVQTLEDEILIVGKPTALRVFLAHANFYPDVWYEDLWEYVEVEDIHLTWRSSGGGDEGSASWREGSPPAWHFAYTPETARRIRLNDKFRRLASQDTVNYYGFTPQETGFYWLRAAVSVVDSRGEKQQFVGLVTPDVVQTRWLTLHARALAVGDDYGKQGTVNLSDAFLGHRSGVQAIYPVPNVRLAQPASAIPYYAPVGAMVWSSAPAGDMQLLKALLEMSALCAATSGCDLMVGYVPMAWLGDIGLTSPRQAWYGMLVQENYSDHFRYIVAHEGGHLYGFEHDTYTAWDGYDVRRRADRRNSAAGMAPQTQRTLNIIHSFMNADPVESPPPERLWIEWRNYRSLRSRFTTATQAFHQNVSNEPLLLATGVITPATGDVELDPWYQLEPGDWEASPAGPYRLVFLDNAGDEIVGYTRAFSVSTSLQYAGRDTADLPLDMPAPFALKVPFPTATARIQIRRASDDALLAERTLSASAPTIAITPPVSTTWSGPQPIAWESDPGETRHYLVQVSTDNGATWEARAIHLPGTVYTLETASLRNTTQALVRVLATDGLNTASDVAGPFTIANPVGVDYVSPTPDMEHVNVEQPLYVGFSDAIDATTLHSGTLTLTGPEGPVRGHIHYDAETREATFIPQPHLAYSTTYTAHVSAAIHTLAGAPLDTGATWSFTTEEDASPPRPRLLTPPRGAFNVPRNTAIAVAWDRALDAGTLTTATFQVAEFDGAPLSGSVTYDAAAQTSTFTPGTLLAPYTTYVVTLTAGIADTQGNAIFTPTVWTFTTGDAALALALTGSYADWGRDSDGDGLYEHLVIRVGVQVTATGSYILHGALATADGDEMTTAHVTTTLTSGAHFLDLAFDGAAIGGRGLDGPYTLADLTLTHTDGDAIRPRVLAVTSQRDAYRTFAYPAAHFPAPLRFSGLPNVLLIPGTAPLDAFNVRDYAQHITRASDQLSYTVMFNANPRMSVDLQPSGVVRLAPEAYWEGRTHIIIRASDGVYAVQDTFEAAVGWPHAVYLPVVLRDYGGAVRASRTAWITAMYDDFEASTLSWSRYASIDTTYQPVKYYQWGRRDCRAYSGQHSAWAFGGGDDGSQLACGADYPQALYTLMYRGMPVNLKYVAQATYSAKVWTNLNPGHEVCLRVLPISEGQCRGDYGWPKMSVFDPGVCRSGQTDGWEDLTLNLANVPELGSVLGEERVCLGITFQSQYGAVRPEGAYVDDVTLRLCPEGLTEYCGGEPAPTPPPLLTAGNIGGYPEEIGETALAVENNGRVHALWVGKLNPNFQNYVFYSSSPDGVTWTPYQILSTWGGREPQIAVDNVHGRVHLTYANDDGIVHHTVTGGGVSAPDVVAPHKSYYLPGFDMPSGRVAWPSLAVAEQTGVAYLVWREAYWVRLDTGWYTLRHETWHATWDGGTWSAPLRRINDRDTFHSSVAAAPDGQAMLAWFQRWQQSHGQGIGPGDPIVARTAYGTEPGSFPLRQATHDLYPEPQRDESIVMTYAPGADAFVLASTHMMWPGHSRIYRYVWKDGVWSTWLSVAENTAGWGVPYHVGAATDTPLIRYVYSDNWELKTRAETDGVLGPAQTIADYLSTRGYTNAGFPLAYFTDAAGELHLVISGEQDGVEGFYYVQP